MIAAHNARNKSNESEVEAYLKSWWSDTYKRPLKDPILDSYTIYELFYEYHDKSERIKAENEEVEYIDDKIEEESEQDTLSWIEEEERKDREAEELIVKQQKKTDDDWMMKELKKEHGDDFGEDLNVDF